MSSDPAEMPDLPALADIDTGSMVLDGDVLVLAGDIDTVLVGAWRKAHPETPVVAAVDASGVEFLGSAGVAYVIALSKAAAPARIQLRRPTRPVLRPLQVMGVDVLLDVVD